MLVMSHERRLIRRTLYVILVFPIFTAMLPRTMHALPQVFLFTTVFFSSLVFASCGPKGNDPEARSAGRSVALTVNGIVVRPQSLDNIVRSSGTVLASESVDLVAESAGRIERIAFREGGHVKKNDLLVQINDDDLQAQLKKVELQIQLNADQAERQRLLYEKNAISKEQYEISLNQVNTLKADRDNLIAGVRKRVIRAPFDGIVGLRDVSEGGYVTPATRIASLQKVNPLKVDFAIPEKYAGLVGPGDRVSFSNEERKVKLVGTIYAVEPKIDPATGTLQLRALCDNRWEKVFPGAFVEIELHLKQITDALLVPTSAVIPVLKGQTVLVQRNGVAAAIPVKTGIRTPSSVQITEGLAVGDTVITSGIMQIRPGVPVQVVVQ